jgi:hypothetical protein
MTPPHPPLPPSGASLPDSILADLDKKVEQSVRRRLGLAPGAATPVELKKIVMDQVRSVASAAIQNRATADVQSELAQMGEARMQERILQNIGAASRVITKIAGAGQDVNEILKQRAELLFKKKTALETAGFTPDQAMRIVLADITVKAQ